MGASSMSLTKEDVEKVAMLARLRLSDDEIVSMTEQLGKVLGFIQQLEELNTDGVEPMAHALDIENVLVDDVVVASLPREKAMAAAPKSDGETFLVPPVL